jgi:hypothetical protein
MKSSFLKLTEGKLCYGEPFCVVIAIYSLIPCCISAVYQFSYKDVKIVMIFPDISDACISKSYLCTCLQLRQPTRKFGDEL